MRDNCSSMEGGGGADSGLSGASEGEGAADGSTDEEPEVPEVPDGAGLEERPLPDGAGLERPSSASISIFWGESIWTIKRKNGDEVINRRKNGGIEEK